MADHALGGAYYALLALEADGASPEHMDAERAWQVDALPGPIADLVLSDMSRRATKFRGKFSR
jgi:hypothetical protein